MNGSLPIALVNYREFLIVLFTQPLFVSPAHTPGYYLTLSKYLNTSCYRKIYGITKMKSIGSPFEGQILEVKVVHMINPKIEGVLAFFVPFEC